MQYQSKYDLVHTELLSGRLTKKEINPIETWASHIKRGSIIQSFGTNCIPHIQSIQYHNCYTAVRLPLIFTSKSVTSWYEGDEKRDDDGKQGGGGVS